MIIRVWGTTGPLKMEKGGSVIYLLKVGGVKRVVVYQKM